MLYRAKPGSCGFRPPITCLAKPVISLLYIDLCIAQTVSFGYLGLSERLSLCALTFLCDIDCLLCLLWIVDDVYGLMPRAPEGLTVARARDVPPMAYATRIARLRLGAENCSGWVGVLAWCHLWLLYNDRIDLVSLYVMIDALWWYTLCCYGYVLWYIWR